MGATKFVGKAKLTKQGQITLPFEARNDLNIGLNSELYWYELNNSLILLKELVNQKEVEKIIFDKKKK